MPFDDRWDMDILTDIIDFHEKFKIDYVGPPRQLPKELEEFRSKFHLEEAREYADIAAINPEGRSREDCAKQLDACVDMVYVALGTAYLHGYDFAEAWKRVHAANMAKVRCERPGDSARGSTFDVIKPDGWIAPDLRDLV